MEYLNQVLGIRVVYKDDAIVSMPNFIYARYRLQRVTLDGQAVIFVYPKEELEVISSVKKHLDRIVNTAKTPAVLIPAHLTYRQKEYLLRDHIPFIVEGKQIYLPFMAVYLQERGDGEKQDITTMLPSAQLLLLFYIYHGCGELLTSEASKKLGLTATSISRASRQLEEMGLIQTEKRGVQKVIYSDQTPEKVFLIARENMCNPVKRTIYVPQTKIESNLLLSGYSALSEYSMINPPMVESFAANSITAWEKEASNKLQSADDQCAVELWRYDPRKLSGGNCVDKLSLALALSADKDERIEESVEEMLTSLWEELNGKRN
ncbi:MAG: MarR family transcriptional regulator [Blautia sp.]|nr:MarR family transcriptional regulator [Blautia sp.]